MSTRGGVLMAGACFRTLARIAPERFAILRMRVLAAEARKPVRGDGMFEKDRPRPYLADKAVRDLEPGDQRPLPRLQAPGQHRNAHSRAEVDQRHDIVQVVAVIVLVRARDQQMLAGDTRRVRELFEMQPALVRAVRQRPVDDRLDRRQVSFPIGDQERVAPHPALRRNEQAERRKPILIDEMLEHHRRRLDGVIEIVDALGVRGNDAQRVRSGPVFGGRDNLGLRQWARQASVVGRDRQTCRLIE